MFFFFLQPHFVEAPNLSTTPWRLAMATAADFTRAIVGHGRRSQWPQALLCFEAMAQAAVRRNVFSYNAVIGCGVEWQVGWRRDGYPLVN